MQQMPLGEQFWEGEVSTQSTKHPPAGGHPAGPGGAQQQRCQRGRRRCAPPSSIIPVPSLPPAVTFQADEGWERSSSPGTGPCARGAAGLLPALLVCSSESGGEVSPEHAEGGGGSKHDFQCTELWLLGGKPITRSFLRWGLCS